MRLQASANREAAYPEGVPMPRPARRAFFAAAALLMLSAPLALAGSGRTTLNPPSNLRVSAATGSSVSLAWSASSSRRVLGYNLYRNRGYVNQTAGLTYTYGGLACG